MTNVTTIPAGYRLTVTSWENDADAYKTEVIEGLSNERVSYLVDLCKMLSEDNPANDQRSPTFKRNLRLNNQYDPEAHQIEHVMDALDKIVLKHGEHLSEDVVPGHRPAEYGMEDLYDLGLAGQSEFFTRVCQEWKVEHIPNDIVMLDVTDNFK